jgi:hypothetical protein
MVTVNVLPLFPPRYRIKTLTAKILPQRWKQMVIAQLRISLTQLYLMLVAYLRNYATGKSIF